MLSDLTRGLVSERLIEEWKPALLPLGLSLAGIFALGVAFAPGRRQPASEATPADAPVEVEPDADSLAAMRALAAIIKAGGKVESVTRLAELLGVDASNASRAAQLLEEAGRIRRHRDGRRVALRAVA